jgi:hypothetical protein
MPDSHTTTSRRASKRHATHTLTIPAAVAGGLPERCRWEIQVTEAGYLLTYLGANEQPERTEPVARLPFV